MSVQVALIRKTAQEGDLDYWQGTATEKLLSPLDATLDNVAVRGEASRSLEQTREVVRAHVRRARDLGQLQVSLEVVADVVGRVFERAL